jgi:hypothetical protein
VQVQVREDLQVIDLHADYRREKPDQDTEEWTGLAEMRKARKGLLRVITIGMQCRRPLAADPLRLAIRSSRV